MSQDRYDRINSLFDEAAELPHGQRQAFLDRACEGDAALRAEIEALLAAEDAAGRFMAEPTYQAGQAAAMVVGAETVGSRIGPYRLTREIGDGGFGTVFLADQEHPVRRQVALKIIKLGMDTRQVIARFEAERQALAVMDHPNIARVFDAGATATGRPYFVMEYVPGVALTKFCDAQRLSVRHRLELFITVCQAVQHAHQKGVIHRDLKPGNVLVCTVDGRPVAKVIDFGIAKATNGNRLGESSVHTEVNQFIGTPTYMSPEQATMAGGGADVDTRSDIYSLGVMLYELLTGTTPFDPRSMQNATYAEVQRMIREIDPPRPSTRLSQARETLLDIAVARQSDPGQLRSELSGELDWIVMRCLEKQRNRRYESAAALAADLRALLDGRPVAAAPPSRAYLIRKFVLRHAIALSAAAGVVLCLAGALVMALVLLQRLRVEQQRTAAALANATVANETATQVNQFLNEMLASADPERAQGRDVSVASLVEQAAHKLDGRFAGRPMVEAGIRETIGQTFASLSRPAEAVAQLERVMQLRRNAGVYDAPEFLQSRVVYAAGIHQLGRFADAQKEFESVLKRGAELLQAEGDDIVPAVDVIYNWTGSIEADPKQLRELFKLAGARRARVLGEDHPRTHICREAEAWQIALDGDLPAAEALMRDTWMRLQRSAGPAAGQTLNVQMKLARFIVAQNRDDEGFALSRAAIPLIDQTYGPDHPAGVRGRDELSDLYEDAAQFAQALAVREDSRPWIERIYGPESSRMATWYKQASFLHNKLGNFSEEEACLREHLRRVTLLHGANNLLTLFSRFHLGRHLARHGQPVEADLLLAEVIDQLASKVRADLPALLEAKISRARALSALGRKDEAIALAKDAYDRAIANQRKADQPELAVIIAFYGPMLANNGRDAEAEAALREAIRRLEANGQMSLVPARLVLESLAAVCDRSDRAEEAEQIRQRLARLVTVTRPTTQRRIDLHKVGM